MVDEFLEDADGRMDGAIRSLDEDMEVLQPDLNNHYPITRNRCSYRSTDSISNMNRSASAKRSF